MRCLDCGNKAKRDCVYYRCRSCCKAHGFQCQTHIKSTWVPISTRQVVRNSAATMAATTAPPHHQYHHQLEEQQHLGLPSQSSSGFGGHFPTEVSGEAMFTRVQLQVTTSEENAYVNQYAYETTINIGGRLFRGVLYDQGPYTPMVNSSYLNVEGDQHNSGVDIPSNLQSVNNPMSFAPATLSDT